MNEKLADIFLKSGDESQIKERCASFLLAKLEYPYIVALAGNPID
jgi:hypothetical protein